MQVFCLVVPGMFQVFAREGLIHHFVGVRLCIVDAAFHNDRGVAAFDCRLIVTILVREIAPRNEPLVALAEFIETDVFPHAPVHAEIGIGMFRLFIKPSHEVVV